MDFNISLRSLACSLGSYASVTFTPKASSAEQLIAESAERSKTVNLMIVLDVSGSMENNMYGLINSTLAAIDLLDDSNYVQVITFDVAVARVLERTCITKENREAIKKQVRENIVNNGLCTNLEEPLFRCLMARNQNILLISDGYANRGEAMSSDDLIEMVRSSENYVYNKFHCLGLQLCSGDLNGILLQTMASDTDGTYILANTNDAISTFLGDVLSNHLMVRYSDCTVKLKADDKALPCISTGPIAGFSLRADRETTLVFECSEGPQPSILDFSGSPEPLEYNLFTHNFDHCSECGDEDVAKIFKAIAASFLKEPGHPRVDSLINELKSRGNPALKPILDSLNAVLMPTSEARHSNHMYSLSASSNQETDVVNHMRASSRMASQSQSDPAN